MTQVYVCCANGIVGIIVSFAFAVNVTDYLSTQYTLLNTKMSKLNFLCESYVPSKLGVSWFVCAHGGRSGLVKDCSKAPRGLTELSIGPFCCNASVYYEE